MSVQAEGLAEGLEGLRHSDPRQVGTCFLLARLRQSAATVEYVARDGDGATVTLLVPHPRLAESAAFRRRFGEEAALAARLSGPWVAPVREATAERLVTAYRPALTLGTAVALHGPLPEHALRVLGAALAEVLVRLHRRVPVHQGLAPHTVLLAADGPRLAGFGPLTAATGIDRDGEGFRLTLGFLTPEQVAGRTPASVAGPTVGPAADVFMLGLLLVYAATGGSPFAPATPDGIATTTADLTGVPEGLRPLLTRCLDKDPARRPTPDAVAEGLAPGGAAALLKSDWLSGPLVAELAEQAAAVMASESAAAGGTPTATLVDPTPTPTPTSTAAVAAPPGRRVILAAAAGLAAGAVGGWGLTELLADRPTPARPTAARSSGPPRRVAGTPPTALWQYTTRDSAGAPPLLWHDRNLVLPSGITTVGVDLRTGKPHWSKRIYCDDRPVIVRDDLLLVRESTRGLLRFSAETGTVRDSDTRYSRLGISDFIAEDGPRVWFTTPDSGDFGTYLVCYDAWERDEVWRTRLPRGYESTDLKGVLGEKSLFLKRYREPDDIEKKDETRPALFLAVNRVTGVKRWEKSFGKVTAKVRSWLSPGGVLYVEDWPAMRAYDLESGKELWKNRAEGGNTAGTPRGVVVRGTSLYAVDGIQRAYRIDAADGNTRWASLPPDGSDGSDDYAGVAVGSTGTPVYSLGSSVVARDAENGTILWSFQGVGDTEDDRGTWRVFSGTKTAVFARQYSRHYFALPVG
ncbi:outer membrane protein assembly factor BamB family protein [Streptomyces sp. NPDC055144]